MILLDRLGRRSLLLFGLVGSAIGAFNVVIFSLLSSHGYTWTVYASLANILAFTLVFSLGPAFIPWVMVSEMFTDSSRGAAMTWMSAGCHLPLAINTFLFPILQTLIGDWTFVIFGGLLIVFTVFIYFNVIETKGKDFDQIQSELRQKLL